MADTTLRAPEGTSPWTPFLWVIVGLLAISHLPFLRNFDTSLIAESIARGPEDRSPDELLNLTLSAVYVLMIAVTIPLSFFDWRALRDAGVPGPFHWAFAFLGPPVYLIGRGIVARQRTGTGFATVWIAIAEILVTIALWVVLVVIIVLQRGLQSFG